LNWWYRTDNTVDQSFHSSCTVSGLAETSRHRNQPQFLVHLQSPFHQRHFLDFCTRNATDSNFLQPWAPPKELLELPLEIRKSIYEEVFHGSEMQLAVAAYSVASDQPVLRCKNPNGISCSEHAHKSRRELYRFLHERCASRFAMVDSRTLKLTVRYSQRPPRHFASYIRPYRS
jgi:hypothetical protein